MNLALKIILLCVFVLGNGVIAHSQMKVDIKKEIEKIIYYDTEIIGKGIPGYSIGLIYRDSVFTYHYGNTNTEKKEQLNDSTTFELGGLSKVFTAVLVDMLVEEGIMDYNASVNSYLDSVYRNPALEHLSLEDLLSHQSGFPKLPYEFGIKEKEANNPYAHYTKTDLLKFYKSYQPDEKEKKKYAYSNVNYALIEILIEARIKVSFDEALSEKLLQPLGLNHTYLHIDKENGKIPTPGISISGNAVPAFKFKSFAASEGIKSTMNDLLKFTQANLNTNDIKFGDNFKNTHLPLAKTKINKYAEVARGWHVLRLKKYYDIILHSGSTNGHRAYIGFVKETQTAVVVVSNSELGMDGLGFLILRMLNNNWKKKRKGS